MQNAKIFNQRKLALANNPNVAHIMCFIDEWIENRGRPLPTEWQKIMEKLNASQPLVIENTKNYTRIESVILKKK